MISFYSIAGISGIESIHERDKYYCTTVLPWRSATRMWRKRYPHELTFWHDAWFTRCNWWWFRRSSHARDHPSFEQEELVRLPERSCFLQVAFHDIHILIPGSNQRLSPQCSTALRKVCRMLPTRLLLCMISRTRKHGNGKYRRLLVNTHW